MDLPFYLADSSADMFCFRIWNKRSVSGSLNWMLFDFAEFMAESRNGIISLMSVGFLAVAKFMRNCSFSGDDDFWTEARMNRFVEALAKSGKALEINELYNIPNKAIIMKAKAAGVKFTFGSNNVTPNVSDLSYSIRMMKECGLTAEDMYKPKVKI